MTECSVCGGRATLFLCSPCQGELKGMLVGLGDHTVLTNMITGDTAVGPSWIEILEDAALGRTRLGESARRSSERGSPMLHNERASELLDNVHSMLLRWVEAVNVNAETLEAR